MLHFFVHFLSSFALPSFRSFFCASLFVCLSLVHLVHVVYLVHLCHISEHFHHFFVFLSFNIFCCVLFFHLACRARCCFRADLRHCEAFMFPSSTMSNLCKALPTLRLTLLMWWHHTHHSHFSFTASCRVCNALFVHVDRILSCHDGSELACMFAQV